MLCTEFARDQTIEELVSPTCCRRLRFPPSVKPSRSCWTGSRSGRDTSLSLTTAPGRFPHRDAGARTRVQNGNAHRTGLGPQWDATQAPYWSHPTPEKEAAATAHLTFEGTRHTYISGAPPDVVARMSPEVWEEDWRVMNLPGRMDTQPAGRATIYNQMVVYRQRAAHLLDQVFGALADATRRDILARVMGADASVSELAAHYDMSFAAVQKHVAVLERARLVTKRRDGRAQRVAGSPDAVRRATRLLAQFEQLWQERVGRLDKLLATSPQGDSHARRRNSQGSENADHDSDRPVRRARRARVGRLR